jgi:hypothetical protein
MVSWAAPLILSRAPRCSSPTCGWCGGRQGCGLQPDLWSPALLPSGVSQGGGAWVLWDAAGILALPPWRVPCERSLPKVGGRPPSLPCFASLRVRERASPGPLWCPWSTPGCLSDARGRAVVSFSSPSGESPRVPTVVVACPTSSFLKLRGGGRDGKAGEACVPSPGGAQVDPLSWVSLTVCQ